MRGRRKTGRELEWERGRKKRGLHRLLNPRKRFRKKWRLNEETRVLNRGQTREICEKQEKYCKGKVSTFTVQSLILNQYPADLLTFLKLY